MSEREDELVAWAARTASEPVVTPLQLPAMHTRRVTQMLLDRLSIRGVTGFLYGRREAPAPCFRDPANLPSASRLLDFSPPRRTPDLRLPVSDS